MTTVTTVEFPNGFTITSRWPIIEHNGEQLLVFQTLEDGTKLCLRLQDNEIQPIDLWGADKMVHVGKLFATAENAVVLPNES